jgi:hypothetical protein
LNQNRAILPNRRATRQKEGRHGEAPKTADGSSTAAAPTLPANWSGSLFGGSTNCFFVALTAIYGKVLF